MWSSATGVGDCSVPGGRAGLGLADAQDSVFSRHGQPAAGSGSRGHRSHVRQTLHAAVPLRLRRPLRRPAPHADDQQLQPARPRIERVLRLLFEGDADGGDPAGRGYLARFSRRLSAPHVGRRRQHAQAQSRRLPGCGGRRPRADCRRRPPGQLRAVPALHGGRVRLARVSAEAFLSHGMGVLVVRRRCRPDAQALSLRPAFAAVCRRPAQGASCATGLSRGPLAS